MFLSPFSLITQSRPNIKRCKISHQPLSWVKCYLRYGWSLNAWIMLLMCSCMLVILCNICMYVHRPHHNTRCCLLLFTLSTWCKRCLYAGIQKQSAFMNSFLIGPNSEKTVARVPDSSKNCRPGCVLAAPVLAHWNLFPAEATCALRNSSRSSIHFCGGFKWGLRL